MTKEEAAAGVEVALSAAIRQIEAGAPRAAIPYIERAARLVKAANHDSFRPPKTPQLAEALRGLIYSDVSSHPTEDGSPYLFPNHDGVVAFWGEWIYKAAKAMGAPSVSTRNVGAALRSLGFERRSGYKGGVKARSLWVGPYPDPEKTHGRKPQTGPDRATEEGTR